MRQIKKSLILFGEGKTEAIFLSHLYSLYRDKLPQTKINTYFGKGGSPQCVADRLIRNHLDLKQQDGALLLLDSDIELSSKLQTTLQKRNVTVIQSNPVCLEGLFLEILESSVPKNKRNNAIKLKQHFQITYLKTDRQSEYTAKLKQACPKLFPLELIESQRGKNTTLDTILSFIRV